MLSQLEKFLSVFIKIVVLGALVVISRLCDAKPKDFYREVSAAAIEANVNYYTLYLHCLNAMDSNASCSVDGKVRSDDQISDLVKTQKEVNEKIKEFYGDAWQPKDASTITLEQARTNFVHEVTYLQKKILIFIANVEKKCGNPVYHTVLTPFMNMYIEDPTLLDEAYFKRYQSSNFDYVSGHSQQCKFYHHINMPGMLDLYEINRKGFQSGVDSEVLKSLYVYMFMKNEMRDENRLLNK